MASEKIVLGLDLGVSSIGWAVISEKEDQSQSIIKGMGVRIVPLSKDEKDQFSKGQKITLNRDRTMSRSQRRGLDRYQQRREKLKRLLRQENMWPDEDMFQLSPLELYGLRAQAAVERITPRELGRLLLLLNQRRGYQSTRQEQTEETDKKQETEYLEAVNNRRKMLLDNNQTVGQYFYEELSKDPHFRIKNKVFPRASYLDEFNAIARAQGLSAALTGKLRDEIIYYQRPLKSKKGLVSICPLTGHNKKDERGNEKWVGPRVAPVSSPLSQVCRIWEHINNLTLKDRQDNVIEIGPDKKRELFQIFDSKKEVKQKEVLKVLGLKLEQVVVNQQMEKGIKGNATRVQIESALEGKYPELLRFDLTEELIPDKKANLVNTETGEVLYEGVSRQITPGFESEPFYQLWHTIYSIPDLEACASALEKRFSIDPETAGRLAKLDFTQPGFSNKSAKAMRRILPYLQDGFKYSEACQLAGYNHSNSLTKEENEARELAPELKLLPRNSLRQPVVEKILNQMIHVVNAIQREYGPIDEIRVELARELRQSQEERNKTFKALNLREKENDRIREDLKSHNIRATRNNVIKYRLYKQIAGDDIRINATCMYCGKMFGFADAMRGDNIDVEHIIPQQLRFDDSQNNKTLAHRQCNLDKGNRTAYDFMSTKSQVEFDEYLARVEKFYKEKIISYTKRQNLLLSAEKLDKDFISRQLQETRYISRKAREILAKSCRNVYSTTGTITEYLRRIWGWNDVLMNLQLPAYREVGLTKTEERQGPDGHIYQVEIIPDWTKRKDHRHHAIDALAVACTKQGFIQRISTLHSKKTREFLYAETPASPHKEGRLLERYLVNQRPFTTREIESSAAGILVSIKPGKKVATKSLFRNNGQKLRGKNKITGIITPRGPLSEESVYGKIKLLEKEKPLKYLFENPDRIVKDYIREKVKARLEAFEGNVKQALASVKDKPIFLDEEGKTLLTFASCYEEEYVIRYPLSSIKIKDLDSIIDPVVREKIRQRFEAFDNDEKKALQGLDDNPIWFNEGKGIQIRSVRCKTGLSAVEPIRRDEAGNPIAFVKPGNNHHLAFYLDSQGNYQPHLCTFWHAVERKKYGLPVIIDNPSAVWETLLNKQDLLPDSFLSKLPQDGWRLDQSLQQNEMFLLGLTKEEVHNFLEKNEYASLGLFLYRVQKMTMVNKTFDIYFRSHIESELDDSSQAKAIKKYYRISSINVLSSLNPFKVKLNHLGRIDMP